MGKIRYRDCTVMDKSPDIQVVPKDNWQLTVEASSARGGDLLEGVTISGPWHMVCHRGSLLTLSSSTCCRPTCLLTQPWKHSGKRSHHICMYFLLLLYKCITNFIAWKNTNILSPSFCRSGDWGFNWVIYLGSQEADVRVRQGSVPGWSFWRRISFQAHACGWPIQCLALLGLRPLLAASQRLLFASRVCCPPSHAFQQQRSNLSDFPLSRISPAPRLSSPPPHPGIPAPGFLAVSWTQVSPASIPADLCTCPFFCPEQLRRDILLMAVLMVYFISSFFHSNR